ncbi:MAG TPA: hypothetical protein VKU87_00120 [Thermomicrobiaceae bacterium]|nr:hypothetical protein [Thermomicrobiaceae bacterium]
MWVNGSPELNLVLAERRTKEMLERIERNRELPPASFRMSLATVLRRLADRLAPTGGRGLSPAGAGRVS